MTHGYYKSMHIFQNLYLIWGNILGIKIEMSCKNAFQLKLKRNFRHLCKIERGRGELHIEINLEKIVILEKSPKVANF